MIQYLEKSTTDSSLSSIRYFTVILKDELNKLKTSWLYDVTVAFKEPKDYLNLSVKKLPLLLLHHSLHKVRV